MPTARLRLPCTAIADSSTLDGSPPSGSNTAGGSIPCSSNAASQADFGPRRIVAAVVRRVAALTVQAHGREAAIAEIAVEHRRDTVFGELLAEMLAHRRGIRPPLGDHRRRD